jgi:PAS domain S-box-containing protein
MEIDLKELINSAGGIAASGTAIIAFLYGGYTWIMKPIRKINQILSNNSLLLGVNSEKLNKTLNTIDSKVLPFMDSIQKEFNANSGKTLKDQLTRIEDIASLNEMRVKTFMMNFSGAGVYECDPDGRCVWVNNALAEMWGRERHDLLGAGWLTGISAEDREEIWDKWQYSITHQTPYEAEYNIVNHKTGKVIKAKTTAYCLRGYDNKVVSYLGTIEEVKI